MTRPVDPATPGGILVLCIGNPDRGDDGVGALVAQRLCASAGPGVEVRLRSGDIVSSIDDWAGFDALICVDAAALDGAPGTVHRIDLASEALPRDLGPASSHAFGLAETIELARALQLAPRQIVVFAVEGAFFEIGASVTPQVAAGAGVAALAVLDEIARLRSIAGRETSHA